MAFGLARSNCISKVLMQGAGYLHTYSKFRLYNTTAMKKAFYPNPFYALVISLFISYHAGATVYDVNSLATTNTGIGNSGTLYYCITKANQSTGPHTINFSIAGTIAISTSGSVLPVLTKQIIINATTAPGYAGIPVILLEGNGNYGNGLEITAGACEIYGLEIASFSGRGIYIHGSTAGDFKIGAAGKGNVIRDNNYYGITVDAADNGVIAYNKVGTDASGSNCAGNGYDGLDFQNAADYNQVLFNHISCNGYNGIQIGGSSYNIIKSNIIGPLNNDCQGNLYRGVDIEDGSNYNQVGGNDPSEFNKIAGNLYWGIEVKNSSSNNLISGNSYLCNDYGAISLDNFGNNNIAAPLIQSANTTTISGLASANATVEIFKSQDTYPTQCTNTAPNQGADFIGSALANGSGVWSLSGSFGGKIVATATDADGNTSEFSSSITTGVFDTLANECSGYIPLIIASFNSSASTVCEKQCISFTDQSQNATAWYWTFEGGIPATSTLQNPSNVCYDEPGVYEVKLQVYSGGGTDSAVAILFVTVNATPAIPQISLVNDTLFSTPAISYQWFLNTVIIPGATDQYHVVSQNGFYSVEITDSVGCTALSTADYIDITGIATELQQSIKVITLQQGTFELWIQGMSGRKAQLTVYDLYGRKMLAENIQITSSLFSKSFKLNELAEVAILKLQSGEILLVEKIWLPPAE